MVKVLVPFALPLDGADRDADRFGRLFERVAFGEQLAELGAALGRHDPAAAVRVVRLHVNSPSVLVKREISRKGAKTQRRKPFLVLLCAFAPLRETFPQLMREHAFTLADWVAQFQHKSWRIYFWVFGENLGRRGQFLAGDATLSGLWCAQVGDPG